MRVGAEYQIHIEQLKVFAHVGVSEAERSKRQRLVLNITVWPSHELGDLNDAVSRTVDYAVLCEETKTYFARQSPKLHRNIGQGSDRSFT